MRSAKSESVVGPVGRHGAVRPIGPERATARSTLRAMPIPSPGRFRPHLDAAVHALGLQVNRDTVLQARAALLAEADRLDAAILHRVGSGRGIGVCGGDPVSPEAAAAFNERIDTLIEGCRRYNQDLREAAQNLDAVARHYGYTEDEIAASLRGTS